MVAAQTRTTALRRLELEGSRVKVLIIDGGLQRIVSWRKVVRTAWRMQPPLCLLVISGLAAKFRPAFSHALPRSAAWLEKPLAPYTLTETVAQLLAAG